MISEEFKKLVDGLAEQFTDQLVSIMRIGSANGFTDLELCDLDIVIICKKRCDSGKIFDRAKEIGEDVFGVRTPAVAGWIQKHLLGSNAHFGLHIMVFGRDEFDDEYRPRSFRLKLLTSLVISRPIFLAEICRTRETLWGEEFSIPVDLMDVGVRDRLLCFSMPALIALSLPLALAKPTSFKVWCLKAAKYFNLAVLRYTKISLRDEAICFDDLVFPRAILAESIPYRYLPEKCPRRNVVLYGKLLGGLASNVGFVWKKPEINNEIRI